jgi:hypothetical protein
VTSLPIRDPLADQNAVSTVRTIKTSFVEGKPPSPQLAPDAAMRGYVVAFWVAAGGFAFGALVVGSLMRSIKIAPYFAKYGNNSWAAVQTYQAAQVDYAAAPVIKKYTGVLAAADVYTASTAFILLESIRLDQGFGSQIHP